MMCRNCGRLIQSCGYPTCGLGWVHVTSESHYCDDPPRHGTDPVRFAEPDPAA